MSYNYLVYRGETWQPQWSIASQTLVSKAVTAISRASPCVVTAAGHGVPDGWPVALTGVQGMTQINSPHFPPRGGDWKTATLVDVNSVSFNAVDSSNFTAWASGGFLVYYTPVDPTTFLDVTLNIFDNPDHTGTPLHTLAIGTGIAVSGVTESITATLQTAALTWDVGYYELLVTDSVSKISQPLKGVITIQA